MWVCVKEAQMYSEHTGEGRICSGMPGDLVECNVMLYVAFIIVMYIRRRKDGDLNSLLEWLGLSWSVIPN